MLSIPKVVAADRLDRVRGRLDIRVAAILLAFGLGACQSESMNSRPSDIPHARNINDSYQIVDCILPGRVRRLGRGMIHVESPHAAKTTLWDCRLRGGEWVTRDPENYEVARDKLAPLARKGDLQAQISLGEVEIRHGNYTAGVHALEKAAEQGSTSAMLSLARINRDGSGGAMPGSGGDLTIRGAEGPRLDSGRSPAYGDQPERRAGAGLDFGRYYGLVIGNGNYSPAGGGRLRSAIPDAEAISALLRSRYGFIVETLIDADRDEILDAVEVYRRKLNESDNLLIYYAGHGVMDEDAREGYWVPVGENGRSTNWISTADITSQLRRIQANKVMVIADSCYAGALIDRIVQPIQAYGPARDAWLRMMIHKTARTVLASGNLQPVLDGGGGQHSVFARALLDRLDANNGVMEASWLYYEVAAKVAEDAKRYGFRQVPTYSIIDINQNREGDFFFVPSSTS